MMAGTWKPISRHKEPKNEVLAMGFQNELLIGYIEYCSDAKTWFCESEFELLEEVHHFITVDELRNLKTER